MNCCMDQTIIVKEERIENSVENDNHDDTHYDKDVAIKEEKYDNFKVKNEVIEIKIEEYPVDEDAALSDQKCPQTLNKNVGKKDKKDIRKTCKNKSNVPKESFNCGICDFTSISSVEVNQHLVQHCQDNVLNCQLCSFVGRDAAHMVSHRYKHCPKTEKQKYECPLCSEQYRNDYRLQYHYRSLHLKTKGGLCVICGKTFLDLGRWKYHEKEHVTTNYNCQHCDKGFVQRFKLKEHMAIHLNIFKYTCNFCGKGFRKSGNLKCHINSCHQTEHKQATCSLCGRIYKNEAALKRHMYEEHSQRKHICKACFKGFCTKRNLDKHIYNYHSDIKPYACEICGAAYRASWSLKNHKRTHTGELPYTCQECGKGFNSSSTCKRHQSVHTGVRAVKCLHCDKTFHSKKKMIAHCNAKHKDEDADSNEEVIVNDFVTVLIKEERLENNYYVDQPIIVKENKNEKSVENDNHDDDIHFDKDVAKTEEKYDNIEVQGEVIKIEIEECEYPVDKDKVLSEQQCQQTLNKNKNIDKKDKKGIRKTRKNKSNVLTDSYCGICDFTSISPVELNQHLVQHCHDNVLNCQLCSFEGRDVAHMVSHRYKHCPKTEKQKYECPLCSEQFKTDYRLQYHYRSLHLKTKGGLCVICGKTFLDLSRWRYHEKEHVTTNYTCDHCGKGFVQRYNLQEHMAIHMNIFKYTCNFCGKGFRSSGNMKRHINACHQTEHKQATCTSCGRKYKNEAVLKRHMYKEHSQRKHICKTCFKGFCTKSNLNMHIYNYHSDIKPYVCEICGAAYRASWSLKNHKRTHTGELPYTCQECGKGFNNSSTCKRHQSVHTGVRAVKCLHCDKTFHSKKKMTAHCNSKHKVEAPDSNEEVIVNDFVTVLIKEERLEN